MSNEKNESGHQDESPTYSPGQKNEGSSNGSMHPKPSPEKFEKKSYDTDEEEDTTQPPAARPIISRDSNSNNA